MKTVVEFVLERSGLSVRKTCKILGINRTTYLYKGKQRNDVEILNRMKLILTKHPRAGSNSITMYLHKDGIRINHKKVERIYRENKLQLKNLTVIDPVSKVAPKIIPAYSMQGEDVVNVLNEIWLDEPFLFLQTDNGPEFRSSAVQNWCKTHSVNQVFSRPGKPATKRIKGIDSKSVQN